MNFQIYRKMYKWMYRLVTSKEKSVELEIVDKQHHDIYVDICI